MIGNTTCEHPSCTGDANKTYSGSQGNTLQLCERHYYDAVTDGGDSDTDPSPSIVSDPLGTVATPGEEFERGVNRDLDHDVTIGGGVGRDLRAEE